MKIQLLNPFNGQTLTQTGDVLTDAAGQVFPRVHGAWRFVKSDNYTGSFGFQWNRFERTQVDRFQRHSSQSYDRFFAVTQWNKQDLSGQNILEVGSGAGRFSQVILQHTTATLYSVDYSDAVEANFRNNGAYDRLNLFQASVYELPFAPAQFDKVFCFGVLQHTPDVRRSVECLIRMVKPGGELIVDFYPVKGWYTRIHAKYLLRPLTRKMDHRKLLGLIEKHASKLIRAYRFFDRLGVGLIVNRFLPICDIRRTLPANLSEAELREWVILDTFDMFSPQYDQPQRLETVARWLTEAGMRAVTPSIVRYGDGNEIYTVKGIR
jgi:SAM-dependent methyltransferase